MGFPFLKLFQALEYHL